MRNKSTGRDCDHKPFVPRAAARFAITATTSVKALARFMRRKASEENQ